MLDKREFYINGTWIKAPARKQIEVINPSNAKAFAVVALGMKEDIDQAVAASKNAFSSWSQSSLAERVSLLEKLKEIYIRRSDEIGTMMSQEMGAPLDMSLVDQTGIGLKRLAETIDALKKFQFESKINFENQESYIIHEPIGVCALITPWNWPMNQILLKVAPALATGCTMILKPSELTPISALIFAEMIDEAGFPAGVFNIINGDGTVTGTALVSHPDVDMVSFTGSTRAGKLISKNAADTIKRVTLELGGKGANIIFADADETAVKRGLRQCFDNSGQSCNAPTRMLVQKPRYKQALEIAKELAQNKTKVDDALKEGKHIGPVVSQLQYDKIQVLIQAGIDEGATLIAGGLGKPDHLQDGYYVKPTVFADVNNQMRIAREELFGPVLSIIPFESEEEAIQITNDTDYGLTNYIQTQDATKAQRVAKKLRSGMVQINGIPFSFGAPFGGYKQSGNGREGGRWGLEDYLEVKSISKASL